MGLIAVGVWGQEEISLENYFQIFWRWFLCVLRDRDASTESPSIRNPLKYDLILLEAIPTIPRWEFIRDKEEIIFNISRFNTHRAAETAKELKSSAYFPMDFWQLARWLREVERQSIGINAKYPASISNILLISSPPHTQDSESTLKSFSPNVHIVSWEWALPRRLPLSFASVTFVCDILIVIGTSNLDLMMCASWLSPSSCWMCLILFSYNQHRHEMWSVHEGLTESAFGGEREHVVLL